MKKSYVWGIVAAIIIVGGLVWLGVSLNLGADQSKESMLAGTSSPAVLLTTIRSDVTAFRGSEKTSSHIETSTSLSIADSVKTGDVGRALLEDEDFKTIIDHDSELSIADVASQKASLNLNSGSVWLRVEKVFGKGQGVEVVTPNAIAAVRGTSFGVSYSNGVSTLIVTSGTVAFSSANNPDDETPVPAGNKAVIGADGKIIVSPIDSKDKGTEWFKYNNSDTNSCCHKGADPSSSGSNHDSSSSGDTTSVGTTTTSTHANTSSGNSGGGSGGTGGESTTTATTTPKPLPPPRTITLNNINPAKIPQNQRAEMNIYGSGLDMITSLMIGNKAFDFSITDDSTIFTIVSGLSPGFYDIKVSGPNSSAFIEKALEVTVS